MCRAAQQEARCASRWMLLFPLSACPLYCEGCARWDHSRHSRQPRMQRSMRSERLAVCGMCVWVWRGVKVRWVGSISIQCETRANRWKGEEGKEDMVQSVASQPAQPAQRARPLGQTAPEKAPCAGSRSFSPSCFPLRRAPSPCTGRERMLTADTPTHRRYRSGSTIAPALFTNNTFYGHTTD